MRLNNIVTKALNCRFLQTYNKDAARDMCIYLKNSLPKNIPLGLSHLNLSEEMPLVIRTVKNK